MADLSKANRFPLPSLIDYILPVCSSADSIVVIEQADPEGDFIICSVKLAQYTMSSFKACLSSTNLTVTFSSMSGFNYSHDFGVAYYEELRAAIALAASNNSNGGHDGGHDTAVVLLLKLISRNIDDVVAGYNFTLLAHHLNGQDQ